MLSFDVCECGAPLQRIERETPEPKGAEVVLKVIAAGVCHSDLHIWDGYYDIGGGQKLQLLDRGIKLPLTMGHENVGEVIAAGPDARGVKVGDVRLVHPWMGCGECAVCKRGDENLCLKPCSVGIHRGGGFATHLLVPHPRYLFDIGDIPPERAAPLACSGVTAYGALKKVGDRQLREEPVVMIGAGGVGLMALALHAKMGGKSAIVVDIDPAKRDAASRAGAAQVIDGAAPDVVKQVQAATGGGAWSVIDFVGAGATVKLGVDATTKGGKVIVVGLFGGDVVVPTPFFPIKALTIQGSYVGSLTEIAELLELVKRTGAPDVPVATRPLGEVNAALKDLREGRVVGRVVITP
ncbi:MAG: alcohol dehydrogenase catalytic domain-containing protein [Alphaproteobacteria bacterium]|nr:alcohol dehydrogenase catalytic domain-containing protein [Alphaproteobacteria bacterium]